MERIRFYTADDISNMLGISRSSAYRIIKLLNDELHTQGKIVISGKVSANYFEKRIA